MPAEPARTHFAVHHILLRRTLPRGRGIIAQHHHVGVIFGIHVLGRCRFHLTEQLRQAHVLLVVLDTVADQNNASLDPGVMNGLRFFGGQLAAEIHTDDFQTQRRGDFPNFEAHLSIPPVLIVCWTNHSRCCFFE